MLWSLILLKSFQTSQIYPFAMDLGAELPICDSIFCLKFKLIATNLAFKVDLFRNFHPEIVFEPIL